jgi:hypothetical protein
MCHVYVIHLKHRTDRKKQFLEAWRASATEHLHWFPAVLGAALPDSTLATFPSRGMKNAKTRKARAGRAGCYLSHVAAIKKAVQLNHFPLLVLEDDALPSSDLRLEELFATAPPAAALLYFGALPVKNRRRVTNYCHGSPGWRRTVAGTDLYGGHAYGFSTREAAMEVLAFLEANRMTFDSALVRWTKTHRHRVAVYCPFLFKQASGFSNIEGAVRIER